MYRRFVKGFSDVAQIGERHPEQGHSGQERLLSAKVTATFENLGAPVNYPQILELCTPRLP